MTRKTVSLLLTLVLALSACAFIPAASKAEAMPMYVYTENGGTLNVRSTPEKLRDNSNVIGELKYGEMVMVEFINSTGWAVILYKDGEAYVQAHFLVDNPPAPRPAPTPAPAQRPGPAPRPAAAPKPTMGAPRPVPGGPKMPGSGRGGQNGPVGGGGRRG